jgi:Ribonuclease G/E
VKGRLIVLGSLRGRGAAALLVDGRLDDLIVDAGPADGPQPGAILRGKVGRPVKGLGGAFIDLPDGVRGFLRETDGLAPGRPVIVQVTGPAEEGKAVPVSRRLLLKGRAVIVTPAAPGLNLSRRIQDAGDRARLSALAAAAMEGSAFGLIVRSAAARSADADVASEIAGLRGLAEAIAADEAGAPELLLDPPTAHDLAWRDWADPPPDDIAEGRDAFADVGIDGMIEDLANPSVALPGGAGMYVEPTRALVAVDVNTGGDTTPAASLKANIAAARELPRQLRLRGLGGVVVIDFAPMPKRDRAALEQQLRTAFRAEGGEAALAGWTPLGKYELQRRRDRPPLDAVLRTLDP